MHRIWLILLAATLVSCVSVEEHRRISTELTASEFNSISSEYLHRPTFVEYLKYKNGARNLIVNIDFYGANDMVAYYSSEYANEYISAIDKFIEWEKLANKRNDMFTKEISTVKSGIPMSDVKYKFEFHSGNENNHFLLIEHCAMLCVPELVQTYDVNNAIILRDLLKSLKSNSFKFESLDDIYK